MTIQSNKPFSIGLVALSGRGWMGGGLYISHIFESLLVWRCAHPNFLLSIFVICSDSEQLIKDFPIYSNADGFITVTTPSLLFRILHKGIALLSHFLPNFYILSAQLLGLIRTKLDFVYPSDGSLCSLAASRNAAWIPDFQHRYLPQYFSLPELDSRDVRFDAIARNSTDIVFSSNDSLSSFVKFYPRSRARLHVLPFCSIPPPAVWAQDPSEVRLRYKLPQRYMLCPGQFWIHKNQTLILQALHQLKNEGEDLFVVFTGHTYDHRFPECFDKFLADSHLLGLRNNIAILGLIPRTDQLQLMRTSVAVVQPSLFEGWSTVVEDARALGKRIILSDLPVHYEQRHSNSLFFGRSSVVSLASAMRTAWTTGTPGPDACCEDASRIQTSRLVLNLGKRFMSIALGGT